MSKQRAIGIDLGTTYSAMAIVNKHGQPELLSNSEGERLTPSAVFFDPDERDSIVVGSIAKNAALSDPDNVAMFVKRRMGDSKWFFVNGGQRHSAIDISAMILTKLKKDAERYLAETIPYAVITVPAYFDDVRRRATQTAAEMAGFQVLSLINEPTAAAMAFVANHDVKPEIVLVYDMGGGTFDVTVMKVIGNEVEVIITDGDHALGGVDFDDQIILHAVSQFVDQYGFNPTEDPFVAADLRLSAEKAKHELSKRAKTVFMIRAEGRSMRVVISRQQFDSFIRPKIENSLSVLRRIFRHDKLATNNITPRDIDRVLLIGGSTRIPAIREALEEFFEKNPDISVNPDEAVAQGAALMAALKVRNIEHENSQAQEIDPEEVGPIPRIVDVLSHGIGIEAEFPNIKKKFNSIIIKSNTPLPAEGFRTYETSIPGQTAIPIVVLQGDTQDYEVSEQIGIFVLSGLPPNRPAGRKVRVAVSCDTDGIANVTAVDIASGKQMSKKILYNEERPESEVSAKQIWLRNQNVQ